MTTQSIVAVDGAISFQAPAVFEADGVRYTCTGYTLTEITKTAAGSVANVITGTENSFSYTT